MDDMVQYVSKDRPSNRDENDIVSWVCGFVTERVYINVILNDI